MSGSHLFALPLAVLFAVLCCGCGTRAPAQLFDGPTRPATAVAQLDSPHRSRASIHAVDGERVRAGSVLLEPDTHEVIAFVRVQHQVDLAVWTIIQYCYILVDFQPGTRYELRGVYEKIAGDVLGDNIKVGAEIHEMPTDAPKTTDVEATTFYASFCGGRPELD